jgi:GNAT acetyltransferase-like protein
MEWDLFPACQTFEKYSGLWDALNRANGNHPLLDSKFVEILLKHFGSQKIILSISKDKNNPAMVFVEKCKFGFWQTFQPSQSPLGLILLGNHQTQEKQLSQLLRTLPGYAFGVGILHQDPEFSSLLGLQNSTTLEIVEHISTPRQNLCGTFFEYWGKRNKKLVQDLARRRRRLEEKKVPIELLIVQDPVNIEESIRQYAQLEERGWKGRQGTAVTFGGRQGLFYREILDYFCKRGEGICFQLLINRIIVASRLCAMRDGKLFMLKTTYDENYKEVAPGLLLHYEILKYLFTQGDIKVIEFYGRVHDWHKRIMDDERTMFHVNIFRNNWVSMARKLSKNITNYAKKRLCLWL